MQHLSLVIPTHTIKQTNLIKNLLYQITYGLLVFLVYEFDRGTHWSQQRLMHFVNRVHDEVPCSKELIQVLSAVAWLLSSSNLFVDFTHYLNLLVVKCSQFARKHFRHFLLPLKCLISPSFQIRWWPDAFRVLLTLVQGTSANQELFALSFLNVDFMKALLKLEDNFTDSFF